MRRPVRLPLELLAPYLVEPPSEPGPLDLRALFGNDQPVQVEVGFGKGLFLVTAAQTLPAHNFLGIEISRKYQLFTANRLAKRRLTNVRLVRADARQFFREHLATASVHALHIYFPDPWWKRRHHKRRLFTEDFAAQCVRLLQPGGVLYLASDVADYFAYITQLLDACPGLVRRQELQPPLPGLSVDYLTNFARKYRQQGRAIYQAQYERRPEAAPAAPTPAAPPAPSSLPSNPESGEASNLKR